MEPIFPSWADTVLRAALLGGVCAAVGCPVVLTAGVCTGWVTGAGAMPTQPVSFDHRHHVGDDAINCTYCHLHAEEGRWAGIQSTDLCMGCHAQIWPESPRLEPVRESLASGVPIAWRRVYELPGFVYFDHASHTRRGVGCVTCHGRVDTMAAVYQEPALTMGWCLDCHRDPGPHLQPLDTVTDMERRPDPEEGAALVRALGVAPPTDCYTCHR